MRAERTIALSHNGRLARTARVVELAGCRDRRAMLDFVQGWYLPALVPWNPQLQRLGDGTTSGLANATPAPPKNSRAQFVGPTWPVPEDYFGRKTFRLLVVVSTG